MCMYTYDFLQKKFLIIGSVKIEERVSNKFVLRGGISYKIIIELHNSYHVYWAF